ncbi:MAG: hypothetical protein HOO67_03870 [Candidatus Peribacteraceae bacterium]|nr:hypothetical protein [Candidatus Peribacteraceae bacterium]
MHWTERVMVLAPADQNAILPTIINSEGFWAAIGVILGFGLSEGSRYIRSKLRIRNLKRAMVEELKSIKYQILQKKETVRQIISALQQSKIQSGITIRTFDLAYKKYLPELYEHLSLKERNCIHTIYEHLLLNDELLANYEKELGDDLLRKVTKDPMGKHLSHLKDMLISYEQVEKWIESYIKGDPADVLHVEVLSKNPQAKGKRWVSMKSPNEE